MPQFVMEQALFFLDLIYGMEPRIRPTGKPVKVKPLLSDWKQNAIFVSSSIAKKLSLLIFEIQFPMLLFLRFIQDNQKMGSGH